MCLLATICNRCAAKQKEYKCTHYKYEHELIKKNFPRYRMNPFVWFGWNITRYNRAIAKTYFKDLYKTFSPPWKCRKQVKISTKVCKMFFASFSSFCYPVICHSYFKMHFAGVNIFWMCYLFMSMLQLSLFMAYTLSI